MPKRKLIYSIAGLSVVIGVVGLVFSVFNSRAATLTPGPLSISYTGDQLFNETNIEPGDVIVKDISVTNTGTLPHSFSISAGNVSGNLASVLQIEPRENGTAIWNETLSNLASLSNGSKVVLPVIDAGATKNLQIAAIFPATAGNDYQGSSTANFSFVFGNESTDQPEPTGFNSPIRTFGQSITEAITYNPPPAETDTSTTDQISTEGTTKGAETTVKELCFWWMVIVALLIIILISYRQYLKSAGRFVLWWVWPTVIAVVMYFVHDYLDRDYQQTVFCHWFWLIEAVILLVYYIVELRSRE